MKISSKISQSTDSHPDNKEGADGFVVTSLQLHVTPVLELLDVVTPPKDSVTPSWDTTLPTARSHHRQRVKYSTADYTLLPL